jgi:hypothetical protein
MFKALSILSLVLLLSGTVLAYDISCNFTGRVHLNKSDLAPYTQDQFGCALEHMNESWDILLIVGFVGLIALFLYGLYRRKH